MEGLLFCSGPGGLGIRGEDHRGRPRHSMGSIAWLGVPPPFQGRAGPHERPGPCSRELRQMALLRPLSLVEQVLRGLVRIKLVRRADEKASEAVLVVEASLCRHGVGGWGGQVLEAGRGGGGQSQASHGRCPCHLAGAQRGGLAVPLVPPQLRNSWDRSSGHPGIPTPAPSQGLAKPSLSICPFSRSPFSVPAILSSGLSAYSKNLLEKAKAALSGLNQPLPSE